MDPTVESTLIVLVVGVVCYLAEAYLRPKRPPARPGRFLDGRPLSISEMDEILTNARAGRRPDVKCWTASQGIQFKDYVQEKTHTLDPRTWNALLWDGQRLSVRFARGVQEAALHETQSQLHEAYLKLPTVIDAQLQLPSRVRLADGTTGYPVFAQQSLSSAGHTARTLFHLWARASYSEASMLAHSLFLVLVQVRYFGLHPEAYLPDLVSVGQPGLLMQRAGVRVMFDAVAPGFYQRHYRELLFRGGRGGYNYDRRSATWVLTYFQIALYGLIDAALKLDAFAKHPGDDVNRPRIDEALNYLRAVLDGTWREFPEKQPLLQAASPLIGWTPPPS